MLELYHWEPTINSGEPLIALKEKGVPFVSRYVDLLKFEQHAPAFLDINPQGQVPVLVHDGKVVTETSLMLQYIEAAFPQKPLMPETPEDRYQVHVWSKYTDEYLAPAIAILGWRKFMPAKLDKKTLDAGRAGLSRLPPERQAVWRIALEDGYTDDDIANARGRLATRVKHLEELLGASGWLAGPKYSLADIMVFCLANALPQVAPDMANAQATPRMMAWLEKMRARPAVRAAFEMAKSANPEQMFAPGPEIPRWG